MPLPLPARTRLIGQARGGRATGRAEAYAWVLGGDPHSRLPHACHLVQPRRAGHAWRQGCVPGGGAPTLPPPHLHRRQLGSRVGTGSARGAPPLPTALRRPRPRAEQRRLLPAAAAAGPDVRGRGVAAPNRRQWQGGGRSRRPSGGAGQASSAGMRARSLGRTRVGCPPTAGCGTAPAPPHPPTALPHGVPEATTPSPAPGCLYCPRTAAETSGTWESPAAAPPRRGRGEGQGTVGAIPQQPLHPPPAVAWLMSPSQNNWGIAAGGGRVGGRSGSRRPGRAILHRVPRLGQRQPRAGRGQQWGCVTRVGRLSRPRACGGL